MALIRSYEIDRPATSGEVEELVKRALSHAIHARRGHVALHISEVDIDIRRPDSERDVEFEIRREPQWTHPAGSDTSMSVLGDVTDETDALIGTVHVTTSRVASEPATLTLSTQE